MVSIKDIHLLYINNIFKKNIIYIFNIKHFIDILKRDSHKILDFLFQHLSLSKSLCLSLTKISIHVHVHSCDRTSLPQTFWIVATTSMRAAFQGYARMWIKLLLCRCLCCPCWCLIFIHYHNSFPMIPLPLENLQIKLKWWYSYQQIEI